MNGVVECSPKRRCCAAERRPVPYARLSVPADLALSFGLSRPAALVNVNMLIESDPLSSKVGALIVTVVVACVAAALAAVEYAAPVYLGAIAWALAGIANETGLRDRSLPPDMADGVNEALAGSCLVLIVIGVLASLALIAT